MEKTLIITAYVQHKESLLLDFSSFDTVICADGGLTIAQELELTPDILIGDYDSAKQPEGSIKLPAEKDMTDSEAAIDLAFSHGARHITILGGLGGRFDHTMGNIGMLAKYCGKLDHLALVDGFNYVFMMPAGTLTIPRNAYPYMGLISYSPRIENLTLRGVKYPLTDHLLTNYTTLGVSNEIIEEAAVISFTRGQLLIILSRDATSHWKF